MRGVWECAPESFLTPRSLFNLAMKIRKFTLRVLMDAAACTPYATVYLLFTTLGSSAREL